MSTIFRLAVLIIVTSLLLPGQCCQTYIKFGHSYNDCAFYVTYTDTNCFNFTLSHCSHSDNDKMVSYYECTQYCCNTNIRLAQNWDGIRQCQYNLNWRLIRHIAIIVSAVCGIPAFLFLLFLCIDFTRKNICKCCECLNNFCCCQCCPRERGASFHSNAINNASSVEMLQTQVVFVQPKWNRITAKNQKLRETCCICLQKGISLELECGHVFHRKCIVAWLRKTEKCAFCRSKELRTVKIYCEGCFSSFRDTTLLDNLDRLNGNKQLCSNCR